MKQSPYPDGALFILTFEDNPSLASARYESGGFSATKVWRGEELTLPASLRFVVSRGRLPDLLPNPMRFPIFSSLAVRLLAPTLPARTQLLPAPVFTQQHAPVPGYMIVNPLGSTRLHLQDAPLHSEFAYLAHMSRLPRGKHLFRVGSTGRLLITGVAVRSIWGRGLRGITLLPVGPMPVRSPRVLPFRPKAGA